MVNGQSRLPAGKVASIAAANRLSPLQSIDPVLGHRPPRRRNGFDAAAASVECLWVGRITLTAGLLLRDMRSASGARSTRRRLHIRHSDDLVEDLPSSILGLPKGGLVCVTG